jgi:hypothetical protein
MEFSGMNSYRRIAPAITRPGDATAPTAIPKRNNVPVDPCEVISEHGKIGQRVGRPSVARHAHDRDDRDDEQVNQTDDDKHPMPLICW